MFCESHRSYFTRIVWDNENSVEGGGGAGVVYTVLSNSVCSAIVSSVRAVPLM